MDTKLIREYGTDIISYRIHSLRWEKRRQYKEFDKLLLRLAREAHYILLQARALNSEPLRRRYRLMYRRYRYKNYAPRMEKLLYGVYTRNGYYLGIKDELDKRHLAATRNKTLEQFLDEAKEM